MRSVSGLIHVMAGVIKPVVCRERTCKQPLDLRLNTNGKWMPFTRDARPLHAEQDEVTHVKYEWMSRDDLHFASCQKRRAVGGEGART